MLCIWRHQTKNTGEQNKSVALQGVWHHLHIQLLISGFQLTLLPRDRLFDTPPDTRSTNITVAGTSNGYDLYCQSYQRESVNYMFPRDNTATGYNMLTCFIPHTSRPRTVSYRRKGSRCKFASSYVKWFVFI